MTSPRVRRPWLRAAGFGAAALAMFAAACEAPGPVQPAPASVSMEPVLNESSSVLVAAPSNVRISRDAIQAAVREHYPQVFSGAATDTTTLLFVLAPSGEIERHDRIHMKRMGRQPAISLGADEVQRQWRESTGLTDRETSSSVADVIAFAPGQLGPGRVEVVWVRKLSPDEMVTTTDMRRERTEQPSGLSPLRTPRNARLEITREQAREQIARHLPEVARNGTTAEFVWILADASGEVVETGDSRDSAPLNRDPDAIGNVQVFKADNLVVNGHPVALVYVRLKP